MKPLLLKMVCALSLWASATQGDNHPMIIDVRTTEEWNSGHLASAQHIELQLVAANIEQLVPDKSQQLYLYCRSGNRSQTAVDQMSGVGINGIYELESGTNGWAAAGQPLVQ